MNCLPFLLRHPNEANQRGACYFDSKAGACEFIPGTARASETKSPTTREPSGSSERTT